MYRLTSFQIDLPFLMRSQVSCGCVREHGEPAMLCRFGSESDVAVVMGSCPVSYGRVTLAGKRRASAGNQLVGQCMPQSWQERPGATGFCCGCRVAVSPKL